MAHSYFRNALDLAYTSFSFAETLFGADAATGGDDKNGVSGVAQEEVDSSEVSPLSSWSPPLDLANIWISVGLSPGSWEDSERLGPSISALVRRWSAPVSGFRPWHLDSCLLAAFEKISRKASLLCILPFRLWRLPLLPLTLFCTLLLTLTNFCATLLRFC